MSKSFSPFNKIEGNGPFDLQKIVDRLSENKTILIGGLFGIIAFLIVAYRLLSYQNANAEADFMKAQAVFNRFEQTIVSNPEAAFPLLTELETLMKRHPELQAEYEGALAQSLLLSPRPNLADSFAQAVFKRTQADRLDVYRKFSQNSLLISTGEYEKALEQALKLQTTLDTENADRDSALYAFNLIRIAVLRNRTGQIAEEKQAWIKLRNYLADSPVGAEIDEVLRTGQTSGIRYIEERLKALST